MGACRWVRAGACRQVGAGLPPAPPRPPAAAASSPGWHRSRGGRQVGAWAPAPSPLRRRSARGCGRVAGCCRRRRSGLLAGPAPLAAAAAVAVGRVRLLQALLILHRQAPGLARELAGMPRLQTQPAQRRPPAQAHSSLAGAKSACIGLRFHLRIPGDAGSPIASPERPGSPAGPPLPVSCACWWAGRPPCPLDSNHGCSASLQGGTDRKLLLSFHGGPAARQSRCRACPARFCDASTTQCCSLEDLPVLLQLLEKFRSIFPTIHRPISGRVWGGTRTRDGPAASWPGGRGPFAALPPPGASPPTPTSRSHFP